MIAVGQTIGNYTITAKLGEGGMGVVYLAEHPVIGRKVALKAIHPELSRNPEVVSRFITEAKSVNQIGNEHIVDIHDFGNTSDGEFYFIMEFLQGESLADRLKRQAPFPAAQALQIASQVADALAASHRHGIIHRDLKPENIFLINRQQSGDFVKVLDFGLAKLTQGEEKVTHKTRTGSVMGTPYYMSPEQCEGKANIDHRADLYSLGVILFEMMTGKVPFGGEGYGEIIVKHITTPPPSPRAINPRLTRAHEAVLMRSLAKMREDRFPTMDEFRVAMLDPDRYLATAPPAPPRSHHGYGSMGLAPPPRQEVSGQVVFGAPGVVAPAHDGGGAAAGPGPGERSSSTLIHGAGELVDEDELPRRSRKGLAIGALVAVLTAGGGAFLFMQKQRQDQAAVHAPPGTGAETTPPGTSPPQQPAPPAQQTVIRFDSIPLGATVTHNGQVLGTTPFEHTVPSGSTTLEFSFSKAGFETRTSTLVPQAPTANLATTLIAEAPPPPIPTPPPAVDPDKGKPLRASRPAASRPRQPPAAKPTKKPAKPVDEDGVLDPSFQ
jgi:tRNA A-37 threonylcarbamoyl transferase component Bud32